MLQTYRSNVPRASTRLPWEVSPVTGFILFLTQTGHQRDTHLRPLAENARTLPKVSNCPSSSTRVLAEGMLGVYFSHTQPTVQHTKRIWQQTDLQNPASTENGWLFDWQRPPNGVGAQMTTSCLNFVESIPFTHHTLGVVGFLI